MSVIVYLSLGSNLGNRESNLRQALQMLAREVTLGQVSSMYETEPVGYTEQPDFLNMVCSGSTGLDPLELLAFAKEIEGQLGRIPSFPNAPRPIDIDIMLFNHQILEFGRRRIPDPEVLERPFVAIPLAEIAPDYQHPETGQSLHDIAQRFAVSEKEMRLRPNVSQTLTQFVE